MSGGSGIEHAVLVRARLPRSPPETVAGSNSSMFEG